MRRGGSLWDIAGRWVFACRRYPALRTRVVRVHTHAGTLLDLACALFSVVRSVGAVQCTYTREMDEVCVYAALAQMAAVVNCTHAAGYVDQAAWCAPIARGPWSVDDGKLCGWVYVSPQRRARRRVAEVVRAAHLCIRRHTAGRRCRRPIHPARARQRCTGI